MSRHRRLVGLLGVGVAVACCGVGVAWAAVTPPAGTPDLALMVLQPADLAPGAVSGAQGYVAPPKGLTAQYAADFTTASSPDGVNYSLLVDDVAVGPTASASSAYFVAQRKSIASTKGRRGIVRSILHSAAKADHLKAKDVKFSAAGSAGVGRICRFARGRLLISRLAQAQDACDPRQVRFLVRILRVSFDLPRRRTLAGHRV